MSSFGFAHFVIFAESCGSLSRVSLWCFSSELWPQNNPGRKGKCRCSESLEDRKPTICAKGGVKFYDNLKIKVGELRRGEGVKSGGQSAGGCSCIWEPVGDPLERLRLQDPGRWTWATGEWRWRSRGWDKPRSCSSRDTPCAGALGAADRGPPSEAENLNGRGAHKPSLRTKTNPQRGKRRRTLKGGGGQFKRRRGKMKCFLLSAAVVA